METGEVTMEVIIGLAAMITLVLGLVIVVQGFEERDYYVVVLGAIIALCACVWYSSKPSNELFQAVENRDLDAVKKALKTVDINATDKKGRTAIMVAAKRAS